MASGNTIIVGGGIAGASPFTLGQFTVIVNTDPKVISDGNIRQDTSTPPKVFVGDALLTAGATVLGGATCTLNATDAIVIGNGASITATAVANFASVVIGAGAIGGLGNGNVVIGEAATAAGSGATASDSVSIGRGAGSVTPSGGANNVCIGAASVISLGSQQVCIGSTATIAANNLNIAIGFAAAISGGAGIASCTVIGPNSGTNKAQNIILGSSIVTVGGSQLILIGNGVDTATAIANACIIGGVSHRITQFIIGTGNTQATLDAITFRLTDAAGANAGAGSLTIRPGNSTGAGAQTSINFQTQSAAGAAAVLGTMTTQVQIVPSTGAAGQANLRVNNVTTGAGVAAGTLLNAPSAGDPTFWLPINIAGSIRYIPCWT